MDQNNNSNNNQNNNPNPNITIRHAHSLVEAQNAMRQAEEEALKEGRSTITHVNYEPSQSDVASLMNRLARRAGINSGSESADEVRKIIGNAMIERFGEVGSDNEGNSSEEEREYQSRIGGRGNGGRGGNNGGRGNGGRGGRD